MSDVKSELNTRSMEELVDLATQLAKGTNDLRWALIAARKKAGFTQAELAELMDITQPTVAAFEREDNDPRLSTITRYALAIGARVSHHISTPYHHEHLSDEWSPVPAMTELEYDTPLSPDSGEQKPYSPQIKVSVAA